MRSPVDAKSEMLSRNGERLTGLAPNEYTLTKNVSDESSFSSLMKFLLNLSRSDSFIPDLNASDSVHASTISLG
jgi:hypothetical protein